jgi:hypothetical protein
MRFEFVAVFLHDRNDRHRRSVARTGDAGPDAFFAFMAVLNELVWRNSSTDFWIGFKLWGFLPATFLFALANVPMLELDDGTCITESVAICRYLEALSEATYAAVVIVLAAKAYGFVRPKIDVAAWKATLREGFPLLVYGACRATILTVDVVMIALILGHPQAGLYGVALKPAAFFLGAIGLFSVVLLSGYSAAPDSETTKLFRRSVLLGSVSMTGVAIVLTAAAPLITLVFGHDYRGAATAMAVLAWTLPLAGLSVPYGSVLIARHRQDVLMHNNIVGTVFYVVVNAIVITWVGISAAAGVRVATYAMLLLLNHNACVRRGLAPSLSAVFAGRFPRVVPGRGRA